VGLVHVHGVHAADAWWCGGGDQHALARRRPVRPALLADQDDGGDQWEVLSLPAIDTRLPLWPEWYPLERLEQIKAVLPARDWNALYQQNPIPDDGDYFKATGSASTTTLPPNLRMYGASDYAVTDGDGDYTEHGISASMRPAICTWPTGGASRQRPMSGSRASAT
jgi:hypothetical protein